VNYPAPLFALVLAGLMVAARPAAAETKGVHVCGTPGGALRFAPGSACRPGETGYDLAEAEEDLGSPDDEKADKQADKEIRELRDKVKALTDRLSELEKADAHSAGGETVASRVFAPFEVLDKQGNAILRVSENSYKEEPGAGARILIAPGSSKNYSIRVRNADGKDAVGVGTTATKIGSILVYGDDPNQPRSIMGIEGFQVFAPDNKEAAILTIGPAGGGKLALSRHGQPMMEAGSTNEGRGVVRVGPQFSCTGTRLANGMGAPDCIMGRLSGSIR